MVVCMYINFACFLLYMYATLPHTVLVSHAKQSVICGASNGVSACLGMLAAVIVLQDKKTGNVAVKAPFTDVAVDWGKDGDK